MERYVDRRELAEIMGVSIRQIDKWTRAGMPSETWGLKARRFLPSAAIDWARSGNFINRPATVGATTQMAGATEHRPPARHRKG